MSLKRKLSVRGLTATGQVVSDKGKKTVIVKRNLEKYMSKYNRYARTTSRIPAHNPDEMGAKLGDIVKIGQCRKISKTKAWVVTEIVSRKDEGNVREKLRE
ncbi:30S ribosomal protein S17 [Candidatus Micrarchaeota archaeon CG11_big_fil_rev_8_21_14_0_20_47_5]|nr:MAG: 30S ribosomal protein S17 [Candidatus Micrarchaeota archaeon CG11_big_fil_rev_8_21_14_0_20_47_5]